MGRQLPTSVTGAIRVQVGLIVVTGLTTVLTVVQRDELTVAWAQRHPFARAILEEGGLQALRENSISPPAFVPVAIVSFVVFALLAAVLLAFFASGHNSARISLTALAGFFLLAMVVVYRQDPPVLFVVLLAVSAVLDVLLLVLLWHRDTNAFLRGAGLAARRTP